MNNKLPMCDVGEQWKRLSPNDEKKLLNLIHSGGYIGGPEVQGFEKEFADACGSRHAVGVASGTDALVLALRACGVGKLDEVICPSFTFVATAHAICRVGARPVFVDIDPETFTMRPDRVAEAIRYETKAILPVHMYGHPADMDRILAMADAHEVPVIEDCAQAHFAQYRGKTVGSMGRAGCFSFFPTKPLGCLGDGGAVVMDDEEVRDAVDSLHRHGFAEKNNAQRLGLNSRLDAIQAFVLRHKLRLREQLQKLRQQAAERYQDMLGHLVQCPHTAAGCTHAWHQYVIVTEHRDELRDFLAARGIPTMVHYPKAVHQQDYYQKMVTSALPATEWAVRRILSLPFWAGITEQQQKFVADSVEEFFRTL